MQSTNEKWRLAGMATAEPEDRWIRLAMVDELSAQKVTVLAHESPKLWEVFDEMVVAMQGGTYMKTNGHIITRDRVTGRSLETGKTLAPGGITDGAVLSFAMVWT